jgi:hypothetical protein
VYFQMTFAVSGSERRIMVAAGGLVLMQADDQRRD